MPEAGGFYPEYWCDWLFLPFPPHSLAFFGSAALLAALFSCREKLRKELIIFAVLWCLAPSIAVLPGIINGDKLIALAEISLLSGCACLIMAAVILLNDRREYAWMFAAAILAGGVCTAFYGWHQHLVVLDSMRQFVAEQEAAGIPISDAMRLKLTDPRIYSTLSSSNVLASLMLIMLVLSVFFAKEWSKKISPPGQSKIVMLIFFGGLFLSILFLTRSRSALFCPLIAAIIAIIFHPELARRWRIAGIAACIAVIIGGIIFAVYHGRGTASMGERVDYWRTSAMLCKEHPFIGGGWGEFFIKHMQIKLSDIGESARDPHNVVAAFAGQCGIPAGLLMLTVLIYPLAVLWKNRFNGNLQCAVFWCGVMFTIHSLIDCDWQVPAMIAIMGVLYVCAIASNSGNGSNIRPVWILFPAVILIICSCTTSAIYIAGDAALSRLYDKVHPASQDTAARMSSYTIGELLEDASSLRPGSPAIPMLAGDYYMKYNFDLAEKYYRQAITLSPRRPAPYARLARIELLRGNDSAAENLMLEAHRRFPQSKDYTLEKLYKYKSGNSKLTVK